MNTRANRVLAIAVGALLLLAVVAALVSVQRPPVQFDAGTPEATVQTYVEAILDGDVEAAAGLLDPESGCTVEDLERSEFQEPARVVVSNSSAQDETARVMVDLVYSDGPFAGQEYASNETFRLVRADGSWLITGEPWPAYYCEEPQR
jgi:alkylation response protein AidB-like acyl-CoA dehydrogenase